VEPTKATLSEHLSEWLAAIKLTVREATHYSYARNIRLHVIPGLGSGCARSTAACSTRCMRRY
jgi:hypothetical protein